MKQLKTTPQKARVKGNLVPEYDTLEDIPEYEDYHVSHQLLQKYTYQDVTKNVIRLTPKGDTLYLALTVDNNTINLNATSNITCRCYYKDDMEQEVNLSGHTVYVYDNNSLLTTLVTNSNGLIQVPYSTNIEGKHTLSFKTMYSGGYAPATKNITITVYRKSILTVNTNSLKIAHDEKKTITWKLTDKNGNALVGKPLTIYEGIRQLATKNTNNNGEVKYTYLESTNRGTETVITKTGNTILVQNQVNTIEGYLKDKNGNPLANQKVHLYVGLSAYSQANATTDANGKFSIKYTPTVYGEYEYYLVYHSNVVNTTNNQYQTYEPTMLSLGKIKPKRSPQITLNTNVSNTTIEGKIKFTTKMTDEDYNFEGQTIYLQSRKKGTTAYSNIATLKVGSNNTQTYEYTTNITGEYEFKIYYGGDEEHIANSSNIQTIKINGKTINISTTLPNNSVCVTQDYYPITSKVTDANNNPVKNIVLKYYLDVEGGTNDEGLIGTATTDNNGNVTFTGFKGQNTYNTVKASVGTHTIITKHELDNTYAEKKTLNTVTVIKRKSQIKITSANSTQLYHNEFVEQPITPISNWTLYKNKANTYTYVQPSISNGKLNTGKYFFCAYNKNSMSIRSRIHIRFILNSTSNYNFGFLRDLGVDSDGDKKCGRSVAFNSEGTNTNNVSLPLENNLHVDLVLEAGIPYLTINGTSYTYTGPQVDEISLSEQNIWNFYVYSSGNATLEKLEIREYIPYELEGTLKYNESINGNLYEVHNHELLVETSGLTQQPLFRHDWFEIPSLNSNINVKKGIHKFELTPFTSANAVSDSTVTEHSIDADGRLVIGNQKYLYYDFDPSKKFSLYMNINIDKHNSGTVLIGLQAKKNGKENYYKLIENQTNTRLLYLDNINGTQTTEEQTEINNIQRSSSTKEEYRNNNQILIQSDLSQITIKYSTDSGTVVTYTKPFSYSTGSTMRLYIRSISSSLSLNSFNMVEYTGNLTDDNSNRAVLVDYNVDSPTDIVQLDEGFQTGYRQTTFYKYPIEIKDDTDVTLEITTLENSVNNNYIRLVRLTPEYIFYNQYAYALSRLSERGNRKLRVEFKGLRVIITDLTNSETIINRTLDGNTNDYKSKIYLGFISVQSGDMIIKRIDRTNHPITQYPILVMDNWQFTENLSLDTTSTQSVDPYITNNSYLFPGIRRNCILISRPLDLTKDNYIRIRTYQNSLNLKVGLCAISNGNATNIFYKTLHDITDNTGWGIHEYIFSFNPILNDYDMFIDGNTLYNTNKNYTNKNIYLFIYNTDLSCYIQDVSIRQDDIHLLSDHGEWITPIVPFGYGTYHFKVSEIETGWYSEVSTSKNVIVTEKKVAEITISNKIVKKGTNNTITATVPQDTTGLYLIRVYHSDGNNTVLASNLEQTNGQISVTSNFANFNIGYYTYTVEYSGDNKYLDTSSENKTLHIGDSYKITNNQQVNNTITVQALTSLKLTGTVKTPFGDTYSGTMNCLIDDELYTQMPVNEGVYNTIVDLKQLGLTVGNHTLKLVVQGDSTFGSVTLSLTLNVIKNNTSIEGQPVAMKKGGTATFSAIVPKDFDGSVYVYSLNGNGDYITGSAGSSILSSVPSNNSAITVSDETATTKKVSWNDRWNTSNTTTVNNVKNVAGEHQIRYRLYNDSHYADTTNDTVLFCRQPASIVTENVRGFENEDRKINVRCIDTLGNYYNGSLNVYIDGSKTGTITCNNNGEATYTLPKSNRSYNRNTNHTTDVMFEYIFQESGYWSALNTTANSTSYNVKVGNYGIFVNKTPSMTLANLQSYKTLGVTDLYIRKNTESTSTALEDTIQLLDDNNLRQYFRVHAVFNCNRDTIGEGSPWYTDTGKGTGHLLPSRITDLQNHITTLLSKNVDGICFDYIRLASTTTQTHFEEEITNEITQLAQFVKDRTPDKTIIISACTTPEIDISKTNYGQNYQVFEENVDYVLPMIYVYDFSNINETNPVESSGIMWQQSVLNKIYNQSVGMNDGLNKKNNKVIPVVSTYKGDGHETEHLTTQEYTNQIISMWNYGIERNNTQKSIVFFRHGLTTQNPPRFDYISSTTNTAFQIELEPIIRITSIDRSTGTLYILWRTKYGGYPSNAGQAYIKIDGTTITKNGSTYYHNINNNGSVAMEVDLTKYTLGTHTVTIVFEGNVAKHIKAGTWNKTITLV